MHEIARHAIHSSETLEMAMETLSHMVQEQQDRFSANAAKNASKPVSPNPIRKSLQYQSTVLKCLHLRAKALEERLRNEINLVLSACTSEGKEIILITKIGIQYGLPVRQSHSSAHRRSDTVRQCGSEGDLLLRLCFLARNLHISLSSTNLSTGFHQANTG
jgi:hypothetical protein